MFEGEYYKGIRWNGKGKEFCEDSFSLKTLERKLQRKLNLKEKYDKNIEENILFEGEYYKGIKWIGKLNEYDYHENKIFVGEIYKGEKWNGKEIEFHATNYLPLPKQSIISEKKEGEEYQDIYEVVSEVNIINGKRFIIKSKKNNNCSIY